MIRFAFMLCLAFAVSGGCTVQDASARCRGGRGIGLRRLLPRNWQRNQQHNQPAATCAPAACNACNVQAAAPQRVQYPKAQFCRAEFESGKDPITVVYWHSGKQDAEGFSEVAHVSNHSKEIPLQPIVDSTGKVTRIALSINDAGVIRYTPNAVRLPHDIYVHKDMTQTQKPR